jgi:predicted AAA+ superfamily ATPase
MRRLADTYLLEWMSSVRRKPLIVRGARQVGKTWTIQELGRTRFERLVTVDLERNRDLHRAFRDNLDPKHVLAELEVMTGTRIEPGKTLLFLDEIQACPQAIAALRYFHEEMPGLHVIAAGSLLEFALGAISVPVGRVQFLEMHPMTFLEFLWAVGNDAAAGIVSSEPRPVATASHEYLLEQARRFCFVGGMPEAVRAYLETGSLQEAFAIQGEICESYRQDFAKYAPRSDPRCLDEVLFAAARSVGRQVLYSRLSEHFSGPTVRSAFELLCKARVLTRVPSCDPSGLPLGASERPARFKVLLVDVGLWQHLVGMKVASEWAREDLLDLYRGAMAEQFVGQELRASQESGLFYWAREARGSTAEVDFLAVDGGRIHGLEVKSGTAGSLRSLHLLLGAYPNLAGGLVFSSAPFGELPAQRLRFLPVYLAYSATGGRAV